MQRSPAASPRGARVAALSRVVSEKTSVGHPLAGREREEQALATLSRAVSEKEEALATLSRVVNDKQEALATLSRAVADRDRQLGAFTAALAQAKDEIDNLNRVVASGNDLAEELRNQMRALQQSRSWRATAPCNGGQVGKAAGRGLTRRAIPLRNRNRIRLPHRGQRVLGRPKSNS